MCMEKFTKVVKTNGLRKPFKIKAEIELLILSESSTQAKSMADYDLGSLDFLNNIKISDINEITKEEYHNQKLTESTISKRKNVGSGVKDMFISQFGEKVPTIPQIMEFYHSMRQSGFSKEEIMNELKEKI